MNLEDLQRTMCAAVMQPLTAEEEMQPADTTGRWHGRAMAEVAGEFIAPNDRLTAFERLEIYNRQYWFRLQSTFHEDFPALRAVVGEARFEAIMNGYLAVHPSRSYTLRNLGSHLVEWLAAHPQHAGRKQSLALDVVRVEWACIEAFDEAQLPPLTVAQASSLGAGSRLALQPHVRLLALQYPADDLVLDMHQRQRRDASEAGARPDSLTEEQSPPLRLHKKPTWLAVHRSDDSLYYKRLSPAEYRTLTALERGSNLAEAIEAGFETGLAGSRLALVKRAALLKDWFANWSELGWLCQPQAAQEEKAG